MLGPDGGRCRRHNRGLLRRPTVTIGEDRPVSWAGKVLHGPSQRREECANGLAWLRAQPTGRARELLGRSQRMARYVKGGERRPASSRLAELAERYADEDTAPR